jgi:uncharacterized protein YbjT (DUF2867 family)
MAPLKNILLVGSTGTIGSAIRKALISKKSHFDKVGVLTTGASLSDSKKSVVFNALESEGLKIVVADLDDKAALVPALKGISYT